ncbi:HNH endonuclease [Thalassospira xiamenensis]|nr:HNH endonuclease [Thalassospira xiamenensis]
MTKTSPIQLAIKQDKLSMTNSINLHLDAVRSTWSMPDNFHQQIDARHAELFERIIKRDRYTCQACGLQSRRFLEVHHRDHNHNHCDEMNLACICPLCHMTMHMGRAGLQGEAVLIWLHPQHQQLSQASLNMLVLTCVVANRYIHTVSDASRTLLSDLARHQAVAERLIGTSRPEILGEAILRLNKEAHDKRHELLDGLRLLWTGKLFRRGKDIAPEMVSWMAFDPGGPFGGHEPERWKPLYHRLAKEQ